MKETEVIEFCISMHPLYKWSQTRTQIIIVLFNIGEYSEPWLPHLQSEAAWSRILLFYVLQISLGSLNCIAFSINLDDEYSWTATTSSHLFLLSKSTPPKIIENHPYLRGAVIVTLHMHAMEIFIFGWILPLSQTRSGLEQASNILPNPQIALTKKGAPFPSCPFCPVILLMVMGHGPVILLMVMWETGWYSMPQQRTWDYCCINSWGPPDGMRMWSWGETAVILNAALKKTTWKNA